MDLQVSVFVLFVLFTAGHALNCYECMSMTGSCANQNVKTCPSGLSQCMSLTTLVQAGGTLTTVKGKDCSADCASGSINFGTVKMSLDCCNTDRCNIRDAPDPSAYTPNGKSCYTCDENSCSNVLNCLGPEDRCIKATGSFGGQSLSLKGCASKSICDASASVSSVTGVSCCEGNLCNGAVSVTQSVLFL